MDNTSGFFTYYRSLPNYVSLQDLETLSFSYKETASYALFSRRISSDCISDKITALPYALYALAGAVGRVVYSLFLCCSENHFRVQLYRSARNLQEASGHFVTLFCHTYGSYIVEKSRFEQARYSMPPIAKALQIKVVDFLKMNTKQQKRTLSTLGISKMQRTIQQISSSEAERLTLILRNVKDKSIPFLLCTLKPEELAKLPLTKFRHLLIGDRSIYIEKLEQTRQFFKPENITTIDVKTASIGELYAANGEVLANVPNLPNDLFALLRDEQLLKFDLLNLSDDCFSRITSSTLAPHLPVTVLQPFIERIEFLISQVCKNITLDQVSKLDFSRFNSEKIQSILSFESAERTQAVTTPVNDWAHAMDHYILSKLSQEQADTLDCSLVPLKAWDRFPYTDSSCPAYKKYKSQRQGVQ